MCVAEVVGCDLVVAKGYELGGCKCIEGAALLLLFDVVFNAVLVFVIVSGGIVTCCGVVVVLAVGAGVVRVGTVFIVFEEFDVHLVWKQVVIVVGFDDVVVSYVYNIGMLVFGLYCVLRSLFEAAEWLLDGEIGVVKLGFVELFVERYVFLLLSVGFIGVVEVMLFYVGQSVGAVTAIWLVVEIVVDLIV